MLDTIILSAGSANYTNLPIKTNTSNSMVPVNGRPVISWILDELILRHPASRIIMVVREDDDLIQEFIHRVYSTKLDLKVVTLSHSKSILHSLRSGLRVVRTHGARLILGDTLIRDQEKANLTDYVYVQEVEDSSRWCLAMLNAAQEPSFYIDKQPNIPRPHFALCGYYVFSDALFLLHQLDEVLRNDKNQISDLLLQYQVKYKLKALFAETWFDFGNPDNFIQAKQRLLQGRFFNSLTIDPVLNTITKVSELDEKLRNELSWYEKLPGNLQVLTPRIVSKEEKDGKLYLTQEYYGYPTLSELYLFSNLNIESWESIFRTLLKIHHRLKQHRGQIDEGSAKEIYYTKTLERLGKMENTDAEWKGLLAAEALTINNRVYRGLPYYLSGLDDLINKLVSGADVTIIHGDFCFSNILYDINSHIVRLIDPRGSFGSAGIYGDPRYDVAKLRHSICGKYDYLISDLFLLEKDGPAFKFEVFSRADSQTIEEKFDEVLKENGYDLQQIRLIEALLFLSMLPLHQDKPTRQKAMFLTGIIRLNEIL